MTLVKVCKVCNFENDPAEMFCQRIDADGELCNYSIALTPVSMVGGIAPIETARNVSTNEIHQRRCRNGHSLEEDDLVCIECGAAPANDESNAQVDSQQSGCFNGKFQIVDRLNVTSSEADLYVCRQLEGEADGQAGFIIKHYRPGFRPSREVIDKLLGIKSPYCLAPIEIGETDGRPYEAYEYLRAGTLLDVPKEISHTHDFVWSLVRQIASAMQILQEHQLLHRDLKPSNILVRAIDPPEFVLSDFGLSIISECDVHVTTARLTTRYAAPETFAGVVSSASDWWSIGLILLELLSENPPLAGIDDRAFMLSIIARPISIQESIPERWRLLLKGLLTRDHTVRWGIDQVLAWINGDYSLAHNFDDYAEPMQLGSAIRLGGQAFYSAERYALAAAHSLNWSEGVGQLASGELGTWLAEGKIDDQNLGIWNQVISDTSIDVEQRFMLSLLVLNPQLPLCYRGELQTRETLSIYAQRSIKWLDSSIPLHLGRLQRETWFVDLANRRRELQSLVEKHRLNLDKNRLDSLSLIADHEALLKQWLIREAEFPESTHPVLIRFAARQVHTDAELIVLLSASLDEFRSTEEIVTEARSEARSAMLEDIFDLDKAKQLVREGRVAVLRRLKILLADFVRCDRHLADEWADTFRFDHRIKLARAIVLLSIPGSQWNKPEGGEHWRRLMEHFRRKVIANVQRGPLMSLRIGTNAARIDLTELGKDLRSSEALIDAILDGDRIASTVEPNLLATNLPLQQRIRRLRNNTDGYQRDTGISSLFLGFPFLVRRDRNAGQATPRFLPLFLWPVAFEYPDGQGTRLRILSDRDQDRVKLNPALNISIEDSLKGKLNSCLMDIHSANSLTAMQVMELVQQVFSSESIEVESSLSPLPTEPRLPQSVDCRVISSGVLFQCDFAGQELAEELERLQQLPFGDSPAATLLRLAPVIAEVEKTVLPTAEHRFLITDADPSQEAAVYAARKPPGLLIQGPPGTGKSQTIVNIVADAIARDKTVLVVCQKQAALEVVGHRLQAAGLGNRIAMIGDPSKDRRAFLKSLRAQLEDTGPTDRDQTATKHLNKAREVNELERQIDSVHEAMTKVVAKSGLTYEEIISELIGLEKNGRFLSVPSLRSIFVELHADEARAVSTQLEHYGSHWLAAKFEDNPLHCLKPFSPDFESVDELKRKFDDFSDHERRRTNAIDSRQLSVDIDRVDIRSIDTWLTSNGAQVESTPESLLRTMKRWVDLFEIGVAPLTLSRLEAIENVAELNPAPDYEVRLRNKFAIMDDQQIKNLMRICQIWFRWHRSWFREIWPPYRNVFKRLNSALDLDVQVVHQDIHQIYASLKYECLARTCCRDYERCRTNLNLQVQTVNLPSSQLLLRVRSLIENLVSAKHLIEKGNSFPERNSFFMVLKTGDPKKLIELLGSFRQGVVLYRVRSQSLEALELLRDWVEPYQIDQLKNTILRGQSSADWSREVSNAWPTVFDFQRFKLRFSELSERERSVLAELSKKRDELEGIPRNEVSTWISNTAWREALLGWKEIAERYLPSLLIDRSEFDKKLQSLRRSCKELRELVVKLVPKLHRPSELRPRTQWADIVMLQGPRAKKLRETVGLGKELGLYQLRPVWLASPTTVSRIFPLQQGLFDIVIFDEASQLPSEYAIPAIYRGKTIIVSGDEKQLPPSRFFTGSFGEDDASNLEDDCEEAANDRLNISEVKDCTDLLELASTVFPKVMLNIHYRSRFRQLIDFSNAAFYEGRLSVPLLHPIERVNEFKPIQFVEVNGTYSDQTNEQEARKVVETLRDFWATMPNVDTPTIGVVTFNLKQADLIEDMLDSLAEKDESFRHALQVQRGRKRKGEHCGFFVKNVESVQGDERDYMIFSTTFGTNQRGEFKRNFGVLGQSGGERRLNVATTRSITKIIIFSSMPLHGISDVHKSAAPPQTPRDHLQAYLMYAKAISDMRYQDAHRILASFGNMKNMVTLESNRRSIFVAEVQDFLEQEGWEIERPSSNDVFQFDLALRHEGAFAIAINCSSPIREDLRFARHRELWQTEVLRSSVKRIHRVWPRAWLVDHEGEKRRLLKAIYEAMRS